MNNIVYCYDLNNSNLDREINGVAEAMEFFGISKGIIVTLDQEDKIKINDKSINVVKAHSYLMKQD